MRNAIAAIPRCRRSSRHVALCGRSALALIALACLARQAADAFSFCVGQTWKFGRASSGEVRSSGPRLLVYSVGKTARRGSLGVRTGASAEEDPEEGRLQAKQALLSSIAHFKEVQGRDGATPVDFGVRGGELDKKSRAPRNLASDGAFYRISEELGSAADSVVALAEELAAFNPNPRALEKFGTVVGTECPLDGTWQLLFTTAADATFSSNTTRGDANVSNAVDAVGGTVTNCIDFLPAASGPAPAVEWLRVRLSAEPESHLRLALTFRYVQARVRRFFGIPLGDRRITLTLPVPGPLLTRVISFFTRRPPPRPYFDILYIDDQVRVHRTGEGNLFVQRRAGINA